MTVKKTNGLFLRIISALIIAGPAYLAIYHGAPYFNFMIALFGLLMGWEWSKMCLGEFKFPGILLSTFCGGIAVLPFLGIPIEEALLIAPILCTVLFALSLHKQGRIWFAIGSLYLALPICAFLFLRSTGDIGLSFVFWLACLVVATDTGAYAAGITIGGPKLAPRISPKKTWAGLLGGMTSAFLTGFIFATVFEWEKSLLIAILSTVLAVVAQMGDLFESHVKRRFGVKDSSQIIPGHGGILDRLDGMMSASVLLAALIIATNGHLLTWF
ncbi:phosphatidate cytidylyltransferase [Terasakiella pusilla]|uniref:phosphatidate cytidylyltransferase n=1 Tax=Terasakiella pusilla TaxID=64973 RepID=UPI00048AE94D|nr:phosphatidate cytidylyltransferase [Terasakiella pusilla]